jgi:hypothetical protein
MTTETIVSDVHNEAWRCICGNDTMGAGFYPADPNTGAMVDPGIDSWDGKTDACGQCGRLMDQDTHRPNPNATDEWDSHLVTVVRGPADQPGEDTWVTVADPDDPHGPPAYEGSVYNMPRSLVPGEYTVTWIVSDGSAAAHEARGARVTVPAAAEVS